MTIRFQLKPDRSELLNSCSLLSVSQSVELNNRREMPILALKTLKKWKGKWKGEEEEGEREPPPEPLVKPLAEPKYKVVLVRDKERVRLLSRIYYQHRAYLSSDCFAVLIVMCLLISIFLLRVLSAQICLFHIVCGLHRYFNRHYLQSFGK